MLRFAKGITPYYANARESFVKSGIAQLALRELQENLSNIKGLGALGVAVMLCTLSGPFGTIEVLGVVPRFAYWSFIIVPTYAVGVAIHAVILAGQSPVSMRKRVIAAGLTAFAVSTYVSLVNIAALPNYPTDPLARLAAFGVALIIAGLVSFAISLFMAPAKSVTQTQPDRSALLDRMSHDKRGPLVSLHAEDHYVGVETTKGSELILIRLADAIELAHPTQGTRIHRSHWVVNAQVTDYTKDNDAWAVILSNGQSVPVSRGYRKNAIQAGLIPARG